MICIARIYLSKGKLAKVDPEDFDNLNRYRWYFSSSGYAIRNDKKTRKKVLMHRQIMKAKQGKVIDHINGDKLDNQKSNLRPCKHSQNLLNRDKNKNNTSGYKGVYWHKIARKWMVLLSVNGKSFYIGLFPKKEEAAMAYNLAAEKHYKEFAKLNIFQ